MFFTDENSRVLERQIPRNWRMFVIDRALGTSGDFRVKVEKENLISFLEFYLKNLVVTVSSFPFLLFYFYWK